MIPTYSNGLLYDKFALLFSQCYYAFTSNSYTSELKTKAIFLEIITELFQAISGTALATVIHPKITYAIEYIKENYSNHITVAELSEKYGLSPKYFGKLFRLSTGKSINTFILDLRIYAAKEMLIGTNMTIEEISIKTGFYDAFYFSKCFKNKERLSPSQYRALMLKS